MTTEDLVSVVELLRSRGLSVIDAESYETVLRAALAGLPADAPRPGRAVPVFELLRAHLGRELDALRADPLYVTKRGRAAAVLATERYEALVALLEDLQDGAACDQALAEREQAIPWEQVRR